MAREAPFRETDTGLILFLRVTPRAGQDAVTGLDLRDPDGPRLHVRVRALPDKGAANTAVLAVLARLLGCARSSLSLIAGPTTRAKTVQAAGDPALLAARLAAHLEECS